MNSPEGRQGHDKERPSYHHRKAEKLDKRYGLTDRLGLTSYTDRDLARQYLVQRLYRTDIYDNNAMLNNAATQATSAAIPILGKVLNSIHTVNEYRKEQLRKAEQETEDYVQKHYADNPNRARTIELAINYIVAHGKVQIKTSSVFAPDRELLEDWGATWRKKLSPTNK